LLSVSTMKTMSENSPKGLKPFAIKFMALCMGICYLANPMHEQIRTAFHEISHLLEAPKTPLSHHSHGTGHDYDDHEGGEHTMVTADHQHTLLDLMDSIFDASDEQNPEDDTVLLLIKCDKHISSQYVIQPKIVPLTTSQNTKAVEQKVKIGYLAHPEEPPQILFA